MCTEYKVTFVGRGQCLRSKLATERSGVCLHPAVMLFALSFGFALMNENHLNPCPYNKWGDLVLRHIVLFLPFVFYGASRTSPPTMNKVFRSIFRLRTNKRSPTNSVGGDVLDAPQRCPLYFSASIYVRIYQKPSSERKGDHRGVPRNELVEFWGFLR